MKIRNGRILLFGLLTLVLFPFVGLTLHSVVENDVELALFFRSKNSFGLFSQFIIGLIVGGISGFIAWAIVASGYMRPVLKKYGYLVKSMRLNIYTILFLSFCAGIGEEFFFRGVLQNYLGVIITAVIFVLIHGYLNPLETKIFVYGLAMTIIIIAVGFLDREVGLVSAMMAHTVIDIILFYQLTHSSLIGVSVNTKSGVLIAENNQE